MPRDRFVATCTVTVGSAAHTFVGGAIRALDLSVSLYGCEGTIEFLVLDDSTTGGNYSDEFVSDFASEELSTVSIELRAAHTDSAALDALPKLSTQGVVVERSMREWTYRAELSSPTVLVRAYRLRFVDRASALWTQHFPLSLYTSKTLKDLLDAERGTVELGVDLPSATQARVQQFLPLDVESGVSFYDAFFWLMDREGGQCFYDHTAGSYAVSAQRPADVAAVEVKAEWVGPVDVRVTVPSRSKRRLVNVDATIGARRELAASQAATGVYADSAMRTSIAQDVDDRATLGTSGGSSDPTTLTITFERYPDVSVMPAQVWTLASAARFAATSVVVTSDWRVYASRLTLRSSATTPDHQYGEDSGGFDFDLAVDLEKTTHTAARSPGYRAPVFPVFVEGIVQSDVGADDELTYQCAADEATSIDQYRVKLAVFDGQEVHPFYQPELSSGAVYIPAFKSEKVLLALEFDRCRIVRHLAWREGARPPADGQGQRVYLGKSETNNTKLTHSYDSENPVFELKRVHKNDTLFLKLEEGKLTLRVEQVQSESGA
ncbi:MAG: hypothetical protein Q8Q09_25855 [Deltaproteobacteria bacterium]|nr:hypothetical protein [Deltaproteobacteria bacterium]